MWISSAGDLSLLGVLTNGSDTDIAVDASVRDSEGRINVDIVRDRVRDRIDIEVVSNSALLIILRLTAVLEVVLTNLKFVLTMTKIESIVVLHQMNTETI